MKPTKPGPRIGAHDIGALAAAGRAQQSAADRLRRIKEIIDDITKAAGYRSPNLATLERFTQGDLWKIYALAAGKPEGWTP